MITYGRQELRAARKLGRLLFGWVIVFSIFSNLLMLTGPMFMLQVYDRVLASRSEATLVALFVLVTGLYAIYGVLEYARGRVLARVGARMQNALDKRVFEATISRSVMPAARAEPASAIRHVEALQALYSAPVLLAVLDLPWTPVFLAAIFVFHPVLGWAALGGGVLLVAVAVMNQLMTYRLVRSSQAMTEAAHSFAEQAKSGAEILEAQGMRANMAERWMGLRNEMLDRSVGAADWTGSFSSLTKTLRLYLQSAMLALGAYFVLRGEMTGGAMIAGSILLGRALSPLEQSVGGWPVLQSGRAAWDALGKFLETVPPEPAKTDLPVPKSGLTARGLTILPPGGRAPTLRNITFTLDRGQALGVIGRSGSGKSTLAKALLALWRPASGELRLGGATLDQYSRADLGRHIGYLPQEVTLFRGTVAENIAHMATSPDDAAVVRAAKRANAHEMILGLPKGYDTPLEGTHSVLSGGQKQRIALARALYSDPVLLVLDEPNSALDAEGSDALNRTVREFKSQGRSVVIMTHRPTAISECDVLMVIDNGNVAGHGPRNDVLRSMVKNSAAVKKTVEAAAQ